MRPSVNKQKTFLVYKQQRSDDFTFDLCMHLSYKAEQPIG